MKCESWTTSIDLSIGIEGVNHPKKFVVVCADVYMNQLNRLIVKWLYFGS